MKRIETTRLLLPVAGLLGMAGLARAQSDLYTINGAGAEDLAGSAVGPAGLYSADANRDIIMGSPENFIIFTAGTGRATVHSGPTGAVLATFTGDSSFDQFGSAVDGGFDFNNDGRDDVIVGAPFASPSASGGGMARIFSGANNAMLLQIDGLAAADRLGSAVAGCGDVNNDGFDDVIVGAPGDDTMGNDTGMARVVSGNGGGTIWTVFGSVASSGVGASVCGMGDLNGDNRDEFAVGSLFAGVRIYDGATGTVLRTFPSTGSSDFYGISIANAGDVDGDMINDIVIGAPEDDVLAPGTGFAQIRSGATGGLIRTLNGDAVADRFGISVAGAGDQNGDGRGEVIVGADQFGSGANGYARVADGMSGGTLYDITSADPSNNLMLGAAVAGLGDVNGDFSLEVAAGQPFDGGAGANIARGSVRVVSGPSLSGCPMPTNYCVAGVNSSGTQAIMGHLGSTSIAANDFVLTVSGAIPNGFGIFFYGPNQLPGNPIPGTSSFRCIGGGIFRLGGGNALGNGSNLRGVDYNSGNPGSGPGAITAGSTWNFGYVYRDNLDIQPMNVDLNWSDALSATFCP